MITLQEELQYIHTQYPGFLERFLVAMEEGRVKGDIFGNDTCGCFYGHLFCDVSSDIQLHVWTLRENLMDNRYEHTPVEEFIALVEEGDTPGTHVKLAFLKVSIEKTISSSLKGNTA